MSSAYTRAISSAENMSSIRYAVMSSVSPNPSSRLPAWFSHTKCPSERPIRAASGDASAIEASWSR